MKLREITSRKNFNFLRYNNLRDVSSYFMTFNNWYRKIDNITPSVGRNILPEILEHM